MLTTDARFIATLNDAAIDPNAGVTRACTPVTAAAYLANATLAPIPTRVWAESGRTAMTKVDFHDRWPLLSTS